MVIRRRLLSSTAAMATRDLSKDLRDRLLVLESEEEAAVAALARIREKKEATARLLELEDGGKAQFRPPRPRRLREVHEIVREKLLAGLTNKDEIIEEVEKEGHDRPGRSVNASLMTFKRYGHVEVDGREINLTDKGRDALRREAEGVE